jgi:hypothetical protein
MLYGNNATFDTPIFIFIETASESLNDGFQPFTRANSGHAVSTR